MPPRRDYGAATRRSTRLASQTNSRASSVSQETSSVVTHNRPTRARKRVNELTDDFDAQHAYRRISQWDDRQYIKKLTTAQKGAVIEVFADREVDLMERIKELEAQRAQLSKERDDALLKVEEKRTLRDYFLRDRLRQAAELREQQAAAEQQEQQAAAAASALSKTQHTSGNTQPDDVMDDEPSMTTDIIITTPAEQSELVADSTLFEGLPQSTPVNPSTTLEVAASTPKPTSFIRRVLGTITSPFARQAPTPARAATATSSPLGELPASRKRPAPDTIAEAPAHKKAGLAPTPATPGSHRFTGPSAKNPILPTSLETIREQTEPSLGMPDSTPSRPPVSTPAKPRSIKAVRRRQQAASTPVGSWSQPRLPQHPNADSRLEKLRRFLDLQEELGTLQKDEDLREVVGPRVKRVKVDDLAFIPHNRPGDAKGTFRVPDIDSDDEMEVDEVSALRSIVYSDVAGPQDHDEELPAFVWPEVGEYSSDVQMSDEEGTRAHELFSRGFDHWQGTGEDLPVYTTMWSQIAV